MGQDPMVLGGEQKVPAPRSLPVGSGFPLSSGYIMLMPLQLGKIKPCLCVSGPCDNVYLLVCLTSATFPMPVCIFLEPGT